MNTSSERWKATARCRIRCSIPPQGFASCRTTKTAKTTTRVIAGTCDVTRLHAKPVRQPGWAWQDSNLRPIDYESTALTAELQAPCDRRGTPRGRTPDHHTAPARTTPARNEPAAGPRSTRHPRSPNARKVKGAFLTESPRPRFRWCPDASVAPLWRTVLPTL